MDVKIKFLFKNRFYPMGFSFWLFISMDAKVLDIKKEIMSKESNFIYRQLNNISKEHPHFAKKLREDADRYITFTQFPREIRSRIKSTNASENLHKEKLA